MRRSCSGVTFIWLQICRLNDGLHQCTGCAEGGQFRTAHADNLCKSERHVDTRTEYDRRRRVMPGSESECGVG